MRKKEAGKLQNFSKVVSPVSLPDFKDIVYNYQDHLFFDFSASFIIVTDFEFLLILPLQIYLFIPIPTDLQQDFIFNTLLTDFYASRFLFVCLFVLVSLPYGPFPKKLILMIFLYLSIISKSIPFASELNILPQPDIHCSQHYYLYMSFFSFFTKLEYSRPLNSHSHALFFPQHWSHNDCRIYCTSRTGRLYYTSKPQNALLNQSLAVDRDFKSCFRQNSRHLLKRLTFLSFA